MIDLDGDILCMLSDFGEPMVWDAHEGLVLVDVSDMEALADRRVHMVARVVSVTARTSDFPDIDTRSVVTLRGSSWSVRDYARADDGRLIVMKLEQA